MGITDEWDTISGTDKLYKAMVWTNGPDAPGGRVEVFARDSSEAQAKLEVIYGEGNVFYVRNEEDAQRPRDWW